MNKLKYIIPSAIYGSRIYTNPSVAIAAITDRDTSFGCSRFDTNSFLGQLRKFISWKRLLTEWEAIRYTELTYNIN